MAAILGICNLSKCWLQAGAVDGLLVVRQARVMMTGRGSVRDASQEILLGPPATTHWTGGAPLGVYKGTYPLYYTVLCTR